MRYEYNEKNGARFVLSIAESAIHRPFLDQKDDLLRIAWNRGNDQEVNVDGRIQLFPSGTFLSVMTNQTVIFDKPESITQWQYNRDFYCILDHDKEVSCAGFLFYGSYGAMLIQSSEEENEKFALLLEVFKDEFQTTDNIQGEMMRMLLKRLIIKLTRIGKSQYLNKDITNDDYDLVRQFNLLVEKHYKTHHQVQDYADLLAKSPKTLSNLFSKNKVSSPLSLIQQRIALEAKRMLRYTDFSASEIAYELGFKEPSHFSRLFKKVVGESPSVFRASF